MKYADSKQADAWDSMAFSRAQNEQCCVHINGMKDECCPSLKSHTSHFDVCVRVLNSSWESWVNDSSSLPVHIHFKASSEIHTREEKAGRLTG